jgi:hypothetical protein
VFVLRVELLCSSGKLRFGRCLRNADSVGWAFVCPEFMTQRLLSLHKTFITYVTMAVPAPNVSAADVFGTGILY